MCEHRNLLDRRTFDLWSRIIQIDLWFLAEVVRSEDAISQRAVMPRKSFQRKASRHFAQPVKNLAHGTVIHS